MSKRFLITAAIVGLLQMFSPSAMARGALGVEANMSIWWTIYEQNENRIRQMSSGDPATNSTSGFAIKQGRVIFGYDDPERKIGGEAEIRLEERVAILDLYGAWKPRTYFNIFIGQMKVPSTYEALSNDATLDFITRSSLSKNLTDWSLLRSPVMTSAFYGARSLYRDVGIALKGAFGPESNRKLLQYFFMVSNGLGSNLYIGGPEDREYIYSNEFGEYFYGARLDLSPLSWLMIGGHYSWNNHENMLFNDRRTVYDLHRESWSADLCIKALNMRLIGMYGEGIIDDDFFNSRLTTLEYSGWEAKALALLWKKRLELGVRFDTYRIETDESGNPTEQDNWTFGLNIMPTPPIRIQINYMIKDTRNAIVPDLADNIVFVNFQFRFGVEDVTRGLTRRDEL